MKTTFSNYLPSKLKQLLGASAVSLLFCSLLVKPVFAESSLTVQSTTSTANSGLYDYLLPLFEQDHAIRVRVVAVGTGQAIRNATNCDADVLLVHAKSAEEKFVASGYGTQRADLMYNDFIVVGPADDPAGIANSTQITDALASIAGQRALFASRGDDSGTHKKELDLWQRAEVDATASSGEWYRETGSGMGATLNLAVGMGAYTLTDRATWISFKNKGDFAVLFEGDKHLHNQYGIIVVDPAHCENVDTGSANVFRDWLTGSTGQAAIARYRVNDQQLFFPNASRE